ncbi:MAG TPA: hypothetical protein VGP64_16525 [Polyangia bacterium]
MRFSPALLLAVYSTWAWSGCATAPRPLVDSGYAARAYTPGRIAVLPPDVFVVLDQVGDDDPVKSAALGQVVGAETARAIDRSLRARGYDVDMLGRWDGVYGPDGAPVPGGEALEGLARGIIAFASSRDGARQGPTPLPPRVAPELAAAVGSAAQADAVLYVNVKGVVTTPGRQTATVLTAVFIVVIVAAIVLALASQKGGGGGRGLGGGAHASRPAPAAGAWRAAPVGATVRPAVRPAAFRPGAVSAVAVRPAPPVGAWRGAGRPVVVRGGPVGPVGPVGPIYVGGFGNLNLIVPLDEPIYTHDGSVAYDDPIFAGDELYVSMTLVSTVDGRVLWHARDSLDLEANNPAHVDRMVQGFLNTLPPALPPPVPSTAANP